MLKRFSCFLIVLLLLFSFTGCYNDVVADILTQKDIERGRIPITVLVKYAFSINAFEEAVEKKFPKIDIVQVGNFTGEMGIDEYEARLKHDDLTDITMTWPLEVGSEYFADRFIDLSGLPFTNKYKQQMLESVKTKDGKIYYLPGPSQIRGIVYNKTLFEEMGLGIPTNFQGFLSLCREIENEKDATGKPKIRALQLGLANQEVLDTAFVGYGYNQGYRTPSNAHWLDDYNNGEGNFIDNFAGSLSTFQSLIDEKILVEDDLAVDYSKREYMLFNRQCAMVEDSVNLARMGKEMTGTTDKFALMPFFNPNDDRAINTDSQLARLYPICYIGANKHLEEPKNKQKYNLVMQLLEWISAVEGQQALAGDTDGGMFSSLSGVETSTIPELVEMRSALDNGRYAIFPTLKNAQGALRNGLAEMIRGNMTAQQVADMVDEQNIRPPFTMIPPCIGSASESFTLMQTGAFICDTMRKVSGCDIALFLDNGKDGRYNGKGVSAKLYKGDLTFVDLERILPDLKQQEKCELWKVTMTGQDLLKTLEYSLKVYNNIDGWFYYFSGLNMTFDPTAKPGTRIKSITDINGGKIDNDKVYSIAIMDYSVEAGYLMTVEKTGKLIIDILTDEIVARQVISPSNDKRFVVVNK